MIFFRSTCDVNHLDLSRGMQVECLAEASNLRLYPRNNIITIFSVPQVIVAHLTKVSCQLSVVSGQLSVVSCQLSVVSGQLSVVSG